MEYYYSTNGNDKNGPFSFDELKQKKITQKTLIWHEELDDWKMAGQLPELKNIIEKTSITLKKKESVREKFNLDKKPETNNSETFVVNEKQKMFSKPFSYKGRIRRLEYGITLIIPANSAIIKKFSIPIVHNPMAFIVNTRSISTQSPTK